ncbi:hypothetical protein E2P81_ATG08934 [Venturia nashicola]|nr:hypothetical protein E2P81_ATG08934 [Venturia nashicola]
MSPIRYDIADFQDVHLHPAKVRTARETTTYCPDPSPHHDFEASGDSYRQITNAFLGKLPLISRATATTTASIPSNCSSGASSPTKSLASFITSSNTSDTASRRTTRHTSKSVIDSWFNGTSAPINVGILPSPASESPEQQTLPEEYDIDLEYGNMEAAATSSLTRLPPRTRRRSTMQSQTSSPGSVASKLGGWFTSKSSSPSPKTPSPSQTNETDPLLNLDINAALFPHGPADPLSPSSFHDLLTAAESIISAMQNAYRLRCNEVRELKCEISVKDEECEESETRARHAKMQLEGMAKRFAAQEAKTEVLEKMVRSQTCEESPRRVSLRLVPDEPSQQEDATRNWKRAGASDSGFESDGDSDSVFSSHRPSSSPASSAASMHEGDAVPAEAAKVRMVRVERGHDAVFNSNVARAYAPIEMRIENQRLRERIQELEFAVEGCLDLVSGR